MEGTHTSQYSENLIEIREMNFAHPNFNRQVFDNLLSVLSTLFDIFG